jgi:hypothetical protein
VRGERLKEYSNATRIECLTYGPEPLIISRRCIMGLDKDSLIKFICHHCEFYKESERDLECGAFKILKALLNKGVITPKEIEDALRE